MSSYEEVKGGYWRNIACLYVRYDVGVGLVPTLCGVLIIFEVKGRYKTCPYSFYLLIFLSHFRSAGRDSQ